MHARALAPLLLLVLTACPTTTKPVDTAGETDICTFHADDDGDGHGDAGSPVEGPCDAPPSGAVDDATDCDDGDASIHPGAPEECDGQDDDCDGETDEGVLGTWYTDADGDGFGEDGVPTEGCERPEGTSPVAGDCDDTDPLVYGDAPERCDGLDNDCDGEVDEDLVGTWYADGDGDGFGDATASIPSCDPGPGWVADDTDCNDSRATTWPGAPEVCDDRDNDCDGEVDEGLRSTWYADADGDGFGDPAAPVEDCEPGAGWAVDAGDCDDHNSDIHPDAEELCDHLDNDCDGLLDDADPDVTGGTTWWADADGDGWGTETAVATACEAPSGYADLVGDCDDTDARFHPGAEETDCADPNDYNCDGSVGYTDGDGDGFAACEECDDGDASTFPGAEETCDGQDDDCDGAVDEEGATGAGTWYADADTDGFGDAASATTACEAPVGTVADATDCDDTRAAVNPAAAEVCDGLDNDCNGAADDGVGAPWYADLDGDGFGDPTSSVVACEAPPFYVADATDCDDGDRDAFPGAVETCDGADDDCDGAVDEPGATGAPTWYADADGDGYGDAAAATEACLQPAGTVADRSDCDDSRATVRPGAEETCDGTDEDCDGAVDEAGASGSGTWYADADGDGFGDPTTATEACEPPPDTVTDASDCDDTRDDVNPGATEVCDGTDQDCDGVVDDGVLSTWYADADGDGFGDAGASAEACEPPWGWVADATDCDDTTDAVSPDATETCDGSDDDCDGVVDEPDATGAPTWYADADGDGFGDAASPSVACDAPSGTVADASDCDDTDDTVYPGGRELCDGIDNDCDGAVDEGSATDAASWYRDADGDGFGDAADEVLSCARPSGYVSDATDCDDTSSTTHPGATEACDGADQDCDGIVDEGVKSTWYADSDGDGYGDADTGTSACIAPSGHVSDGTDCDDASAAVSPGATEACNGLDDDCDGSTDEPDAADAGTWYYDRDRDGHGDPTVSEVSCTAPSGYVSSGDDCDDADRTVHPGATEVCNGLDDDCDGSTDEGVTPTWYADTDGDGYGSATSSASACTAPTGYVSDRTDCDDGAASVYPGATEVCDDVDQDCDGTVDDGAIDAPTWYIDYDRDGYGSTSYAYAACDAPTGYIGTATDCNDRDGDVNPGADEVCNEVDDDCDGTVDEDSAVDAPTWYADDDCDGYGDATTGAPSCEGPSGTVEDDTDCDDGDPLVNPGVLEMADAVDNDCDGSVDEGAYEPTVIATSGLDGLDAPASPGACGTIGEVGTTYNPHYLTNIDSFMAMLDGSVSGLASSVDVTSEVMDWSVRCGSDYDASIGNWSTSTQEWPVVPTTGSYGAARFRGYLNIRCGDPLQYTFGLIGNDSLTLSIGGTYIMGVNWSDGQWKKFRYVAFPGPGLYPFEVEWSTNLVCDIDPFELVWAEGFKAGYDDYDSMCYFSSCTYGNGVPIPGFAVVDGDWLVSATDGGATSCAPCATDTDCGTGERCNSAGLCE